MAVWNEIVLVKNISMLLWNSRITGCSATGILPVVIPPPPSLAPHFSFSILCKFENMKQVSGKEKPKIVITRLKLFCHIGQVQCRSIALQQYLWSEAVWKSLVINIERVRRTEPHLHGSEVVLRLFIKECIKANLLQKKAYSDFFFIWYNYLGNK